MKSVVLYLACGVFAVTFGALSAALNNETEDAQAQADDLRAAPAQALALAQADDLAFRSQHPSAAQPARRRHPSTLSESTQ